MRSKRRPFYSNDKKIYWCDGGTDVIEEANLDGSSRRTIIFINSGHPFGLELYGNYLYWTDWNGRGMYRVNIQTQIATIVSNDARLYRPGGIYIHQEDQENPEIIDCPNDITVNTTNGQPVAVNVTWTKPTAIDNSGETLELESDYTSGENMFVIGNTTVQYNVSDSSGNFNDRCSFTVTVEAILKEDNEAPVITCPTNVTSNNYIAESLGVINVNTDEGSPNSTVTWDPPVAFDNSNENVTVVSSPYQSGDMIPVGNSPTEIVFTATDPYGNADSCVFVIQVQDNEYPVLRCPDEIVMASTDTNLYYSTVYWNVSVTDNSGSATVNCTSKSGDQFNAIWPVAQQPVTCLAVDPYNNVESYTENPNITCPTSKTVMTDDGLPFAEYNYTVDVLDNSDEVILPVCSTQSGFNFPIGGTIVECNATDLSNNSASCSFTVEVEDQEDPIIVDCPNDITVNTTNGQPVAVNVTWTEPIATDNSGETPEPESNYNSGDNMFLIGHTTVQYNVSDSSGNFNDRCNFTVTVEDKELPVPSCPSLVNGVTDEGKPNGTVNYNITVMDNVQVAMFTTNYTNINPAAMTIDAAYSVVETTGVFPIGQTVIEYIFVDSASPTSNEATCYITLQIEGNIIGDIKTFDYKVSVAATDHLFIQTYVIVFASMCHFIPF
ncbi:hyalin-like [Anneissia japonica]|uniref:hyalin-like n=1 Tax=Anneissia japonica TaxID=1529436 RepID=UPI00142562D4|nr:hyalin-like [Anneissia japonica]